jgi:hypothetical protein
MYFHCCSRIVLTLFNQFAKGGTRGVFVILIKPPLTKPLLNSAGLVLLVLLVLLLIVLWLSFCLAILAIVVVDGIVTFVLVVAVAIDVVVSKIYIHHTHAHDCSWVCANI